MNVIYYCCSRQKKCVFSFVISMELSVLPGIDSLLTQFPVKVAVDQWPNTIAME